MNNNESIIARIKGLAPQSSLGVDPSNPNSNQQTSVKAILEIRRNADGEIRRDPNLWDYYGDFIWTEGNFSCDCNRYLFFCRSIGEPEAEDQDAPEHSCGDERFSIRLTDETGKVLYEDFSGQR